MELQSTEKTPIQSTRDPFNVIFYKQAEAFSSAVIEAIPELQGVALVPIWNVQPNDTPPGLLRLRDPEAPYLAVILQLLGRLAAFNVELHRDFVSQIKVFDSYAAQLAEKIKEYTGELENLQKAKNAVTESAPPTTNE